MMIRRADHNETFEGARLRGPKGRLLSPRVAWGALAVYAAVLTYMLVAPDPLAMLGITGRMIGQTIDRTLADYAQHCLAYALLAWLLVWASQRAAGSWQIVWGLLAIGHGVLTEWLQSFVPLRYCVWSDALANVLGLGLGWVSAALVLWILGKGSPGTISNLTRIAALRK